MSVGLCTTFTSGKSTISVKQQKKYSTNISGVGKSDSLLSIPESQRIKYYIKVILLGDSGVGKTTLLQSFCQCSECNANQLLSRLTMEGQKGHSRIYMGSQKCHTNLLQIDGSMIQLRIHDTAGEERYRSITPSYYRGAHGCLLLFDVTKSQSFENVIHWLEDLKQYSLNPENLVKILVGTRCHDNQQREITFEKAQTFATNMDIPYIEISSAENFNVTNCFEKIATEIIQTFNKNPSVYRHTDMKTENLIKTLKRGKYERDEIKDKCFC